ncbi:hypothetical protein F7725_016443 [Dissostichus mawsoni]|uniref:Immunoglobulin V-set domain-containing protein n=1 Tax=Dissostichus mawsoni TaxID=36200 RepID=A0A7J5Z221_DISMA|nr:hypothetical protein F7725_016443 [Dissostichus mawsoni]
MLSVCFQLLSNFTRSPTIGQNITYWCQYPEGAPVKQFICKGEDPSICEHVVSTAQNTERFSMIDETEKRNITITVRGLTKEDSGTYWCGAEHIDSLQGQYSYQRFLMTVECVCCKTKIVTGSLYNLTSIVPHTTSYDRASVLEIALALSLDVMLLTLAVYLAYTVKPTPTTFPVSSTNTAFAESRETRYRAALRKIQLEVKDSWLYMNYTEITCKILTLFIVEKSLSQFTLETGMTSPAEDRRRRNVLLSVQATEASSKERPLKRAFIEVSGKDYLERHISSEPHQYSIIRFPCPLLLLSGNAKGPKSTWVVQVLV